MDCSYWKRGIVLFCEEGSVILLQYSEYISQYALFITSDEVEDVGDHMGWHLGGDGAMTTNDPGGIYIGTALQGCIDQLQQINPHYIALP